MGNFLDDIRDGVESRLEDVGKNPFRDALAIATMGQSELLYMETDAPELEKQGTPPNPNDPRAKAAADKAAADSRRGRASTILTSPASIANSTVNLSRRTLLGA